MVYQTNALDVTVSESSDIQSGILPELFMETVLSQTEAFLGEKVVVTYVLYSRYNIHNSGFTGQVHF
jgi:hypothetical protein